MVTRKSVGSRQSTLLSFHVFFALQAYRDQYAVECFQRLAQQLAVALHHEERRCAYLTAQKDAMSIILDDVASCPEDSRESPWMLMIQKCPLAKTLKTIYDSVCRNGLVEAHINNWVRISWCLPYVVHSANLPEHVQGTISPEAIHRCAQGLRPYHGILLLVSEETLLSSLPLDASPALTRLIQVLSPLKNLHQLAADATLALSQVLKLALHLVSWGKAMVIYPLCEKNVYTLSANANTSVTSQLAEAFEQEFSGKVLAEVLSQFSLPSPLGQHKPHIMAAPTHQTQQVRMVVWLLRQHLLVQQHTYVYLLISNATNTLSSYLRHRFDASQALNNSEEYSASEKASLSRESTPSETQIVLRESLVNDRDTASKDVDLNALKKLHKCLPADLSGSLAHIPAYNHYHDLQLFLSLLPYLDGRHHLEEIMYYENMERSQLLMVLDKFRHVLVTCHHEDSNITAWTMNDTGNT